MFNLLSHWLFLSSFVRQSMRSEVVIQSYVFNLMSHWLFLSSFVRQSMRSEVVIQSYVVNLLSHWLFLSSFVSQSMRSEVVIQSYVFNLLSHWLFLSSFVRQSMRSEVVIRSYVLNLLSHWLFLSSAGASVPTWSADVIMLQHIVAVCTVGYITLLCSQLATHAIHSSLRYVVHSVFALLPLLFQARTVGHTEPAKLIPILQLPTC